ncbi:MAG: hypothetical protein HZA29_03595 [Candidatus Omnitrophica bacterium]|nr:hypothetical protein [Candidatus Omnitrophota bacterium]
MGVIYKFKKEVIDFVLQQKRDNQSLGCRQLAVLTSEKFKLQVSKSSVNAIIKNARLSSGVGRRPGFEPAPRKFQIPSRKKEQLSDEMRKVGLEKKKQPAASVPRPVRRAAAAASRTPQAAVTQDFLDQVERLRQERIRRKGPVREGMGCVFLMAAQWELSRTSVLGKLLRKYARQQLPDLFDAACDILPCLSALGVNPAEQIGQLSSHALWTFLPPSVFPGDVLEAFHGLSYILPSRRLLFEYEEEKKQMLVEAGEFRVLLEDGSEIVMDARLTGVWPQKAPPQLSAPLEQAMSALSHGLVSNNRPAVFLSSAGRLSPDGDLRPSGGAEQFHHGVGEMIAACEGLANKRPKKLDVLSPSGELLAAFSSFPDKKRIFMLGVWPWQKEFTFFLKAAGGLEPFYCEELDRVVYVRDWLTSPPPSGIFQGQLKGAGPFRAIAVSMSSPAAEAVIFTNWVQGAVKDAAVAFLRRWPYLDKGPAGRVLAHGTDKEARLSLPEFESLSSQAEQTELSVLSRDLGEALHRYCQKRFFEEFHTKDDINAFRSIYYGISGSCSSGKERVEIVLNPPAGHERLDELRLAAQRLNESAVTDSWNRQLFVTVE